MQERRRTSAHDMADAIISDIRAGRLAVGDRLREQDLAERFKTSRGPVREALKLLVSQFWVSHEAGRGARVIEIHPLTHPDAGVVARALNAPLIQFAASRGTTADHDRLDALVHEMADAARASADPAVLAEMEWKAGRFLHTMSRSPILQEALRRFEDGAITLFNIESKRTAALRAHTIGLWFDVAINLRNRNAALALAAFDGIVDLAIRTEARSNFYPHELEDT